MYKPQYLKRWTLPRNYFGAEWPDYYRSGVGRSRDSESLERSNFICMLDHLGSECESVIVVRESHWAVGWVEWIAIHESDTRALEIADEIRGRLDDYPVVDEDHWSNLEYEEMADYWERMPPRCRVQWAMDVRKRYHWFAKKAVWHMGRWDFSTLVANSDNPIAQAIYESLRS